VDTDVGGGLMQYVCQLQADRIAEADMGDESFAEEGADASASAGRSAPF
jgi:hypothetical protein